MSDAHPRAPDPNPDVTAACGNLGDVFLDIEGITHGIQGA